MKRSNLFPGLALALFGTLYLLNNLGRPRIDALHGIDILRLVTSGFSFGVAFIFCLVGGICGRRRALGMAVDEEPPELLQVESARQNATFIFGRERRETGENVGHVKLCCNSARRSKT